MSNANFQKHRVAKTKNKTNIVRSVLEILLLNALGELWTDEFQPCQNWSNNVCFMLCFSHSMLLKVCVCHMLEKPVSFNIFSKNCIHLISKFCCEYKWCDTLCIMHDILDCFPQIMFAQKEIILILMSISTGYQPHSP